MLCATLYTPHFLVVVHLVIEMIFNTKLLDGTHNGCLHVDLKRVQQQDRHNFAWRCGNIGSNHIPYPDEHCRLIEPCLDLACIVQAIGQCRQLAGGNMAIVNT